MYKLKCHIIYKAKISYTLSGRKVKSCSHIYFILSGQKKQNRHLVSSNAATCPETPALVHFGVFFVCFVILVTSHPCTLTLATVPELFLAAQRS